MSHKRDFFDINQAHSYLTNSVIRLDGEPVYVYEVSSLNKRDGWKNDFNIHYQTVGNDNHQSATTYQDPKVDLSPVTLGLVNWVFPTGNKGNSIVWAARMPRRGWKVGLSTGALYLTGDKVYRDIEKNHFLLSSPFRQTVVGNYPSYKKALTKVQEDKMTTRLAFSRRFYLTAKGNVGYKAIPQPVGEWDKNGAVKLKDEFQYLMEVLDEDMQ